MANPISHDSKFRLFLGKISTEISENKHHASIPALPREMFRAHYFPFSRLSLKWAARVKESSLFAATDSL